MRKLFYFLILSVGLFGIEERVVICGVARDVAGSLSNMIKTIEDLGGLFSDYRVIVYENDSKDETPLLLYEWMQRNSKVFVSSEVTSNVEYVNLTWDGVGNRPERIARARNIVLERALSKEYARFPYLIWIDMDFGKPFSFEGIIETFQKTSEWDAVFANGVDKKGRYFDWFAFRDKKYPIGPELLGNSWWDMVAKEKKQLRFKKTGAWHPVYSAFGGLGIYKKSSIQNCRYDAVVTKDLSCFVQRLLKEKNWLIQRYHKRNQKLLHYIRIPCEPKSNLPRIQNLQTAILLGSDVHTPVWRMNSGVCQYPATCEHVPFHASMILQGHDKLFINPRIILDYENR